MIRRECMRKISKDIWDDVYSMTVEEAQSELLRLDASIGRHTYFYFHERSPRIDDYEFDTMVARRQAIADVFGNRLFLEMEMAI
jgi:NAD-dependent DNA ligase